MCPCGTGNSLQSVLKTIHKTCYVNIIKQWEKCASSWALQSCYYRWLYFSEYLLKSVSIILILYAKVQCKQKALLEGIYFNIFKGLSYLFRPSFLLTEQIQRPFFSYKWCFQCHKNDSCWVTWNNTKERCTTKKWVLEEMFISEFLHCLVKQKSWFMLKSRKFSIYNIFKLFSKHCLMERK